MATDPIKYGEDEEAPSAMVQDSEQASVTEAVEAAVVPTKKPSSKKTVKPAAPTAPDPAEVATVVAMPTLRPAALRAAAIADTGNVGVDVYKWARDNGYPLARCLYRVVAKSEKYAAAYPPGEVEATDPSEAINRFVELRKIPLAKVHAIAFQAVLLEG